MVVLEKEGSKRNGLFVGLLTCMHVILYVSSLAMHYFVPSSFTNVCVMTLT